MDSVESLHNKLKLFLSKSTAAQRISWAQELINNEIGLRSLSNLLYEGSSTSTRFLWFLSEVGNLNPTLLLDYLPKLFELRKKDLKIDLDASLATFCLICGVPVVNESEAISLFFDILIDSNVNVTTKTRALKVLKELTIKYPDLKVELKNCLTDQIDKNTSEFNRMGVKILKGLDEV